MSTGKSVVNTFRHLFPGLEQFVQEDRKQPGPIERCGGGGGHRGGGEESPQ